MSEPHDRPASFDAALVAALPGLCRVARAIGGNRSIADELVSETLCRALGAWEQFAPGTRMMAWLSVICRNCWYNQLRDVRRLQDPRVRASASLDPILAPRGDLCVEVTETAKMLELLSPESQRVIFAAGRGLAQDEIATELAIPVGTVKSRLYRARATLAEMRA